jgi:Lysyl-tRNA synthetase (class II)
MFSLDKVGEAVLESWKSDIDLGDIVSVTGEVITSKRGELSILANSYQIASKAYVLFQMSITRSMKRRGFANDMWI